MQKGQILIWIIVGALIILIAGGAYFLGRSTSPKPAANPVVTSPASTHRGEQTPQPTSFPVQNEKTFCSNNLNFCVKIPADWEAEEGLNPQGGTQYVVTIKDQSNQNNSIWITKLDRVFGSTVKQAADYYLKPFIPEIVQGTVRRNVSTINGQNELLIFPSPSPDPRTVAYSYGVLFVQPELNSDIFSLSAGSAPNAGELVGDTLLKVASSLKISK
ncbi:hypothetical protein HYS96_01260 [Candidatus Daviesbacteria bacterium]|nr:hypothetical protein [Candidatus Daviesbacteria bacterium]